MEQIIFNQMTLRDTIIDALSYIGIKDLHDFDLKEKFFNNPNPGKHDARHIYRTMLAAALIARKLKEPRKGLLAFCGAFIHDLAQNVDGEGRDHGPRAAKTKWSIFHDLWEKYCLTDEECSIVRSAVSHHSGEGNSGFIDDPVVIKILHDADALDRCRFFQRGRFDWNYVATPELKVNNGHPNSMLKALIGETEAICGYTKHVPPFMPFCDFLSYIR